MALLIGLAQAVAILPGVSRAGSTIAIAMWLGGVECPRCTIQLFSSRFQSLLGQAFYKSETLLNWRPQVVSGLLLLVAAGCAFVCGILALKLLLFSWIEEFFLDLVGIACQWARSPSAFSEQRRCFRLKLVWVNQTQSLTDTIVLDPPVLGMRSRSVDVVDQ